MTGHGTYVYNANADGTPMESTRKYVGGFKAGLAHGKGGLEPVMILQRTFVSMEGTVLHSHGLDFHSRVLLCHSMTGRGRTRRS